MGFAIVVGVLALALAVLLPATYRSESKLLVRLGRESVTLDPTTTIGATVTPIQSRESEINSELQILKSLELAERVVGHLGHAALGAPDAAAAVTDLQQRLALGVEPETAILTIAAEAADPAEAQRLVEAYVAAFLQLRSEVHRNPTAEAFFAEQKAAADAALLVVETQLKDLKDATGVASLAEQRAVLLTRIGELERQLDAANADLFSTAAAVEALQARLADLPETIVTSTTTGSPMDSLDDLRQKVNELKLREQDLAARYVTTSPSVQIVRQKIARAETLLAEATNAVRQETRGLNKTREELDLRLETQRAEHAALVARHEALTADLAEARSRIGTLNEVELRLGALAREAGIREENLRKYAESFEQARIDKAMHDQRISNISTVQAATLPSRPASPNRLLLVVGGLFAGVAGGLLLAFAAEAMDRTLKRPGDIEKLGLGKGVSMPLAAAGLPAVTIHSTGGGLSRRMLALHTGRRLAVVVSAALAAAWGKLLTHLGLMQALARDAAEQLGQAYRRRTWQTDWATIPPVPWRHAAAYRDKLQQALPPADVHPSTLQVEPAQLLDLEPTPDDAPTHELNPQLVAASLELVERLLTPADVATVGFVSASAGEGTTHVARHVAAALAQLNDSRSRQPAASGCLVIDANFLRPWHEAAGPATSVEPADLLATARLDEACGVHVLPLAAIVPLVTPALLEALLAEATRVWPRVIVDLPPVLDSGLTARLAAACQSVLFVAEANRQRAETCLAAAERLDEAGAHVLGVVLNKRTFPIPEWLYRRA